jgi:hypothetical protein
METHCDEVNRDGADPRPARPLSKTPATVRSLGPSSARTPR